MGMAEVGYASFASSLICRIGQDDFLADRDLGCEHHQSAMRADRHGERLLLESPMIGGFAANEYR